MKAATLAVALACFLPGMAMAENWCVVRSGDTLWSIARRHGVSVAEVRKLNTLASDSLRVGQKLRLQPAAERQPDRTATAPVAASSGQTVHTVSHGDSLWSVSRKYGVTVAQVRAWNDLASDSLRTGQILKLRATTAAAETRRQSSAAPEVQSAASGRAAFSWPVTGRVVEKFGIRQKGIVNGITIAAPDGTGVRAAAGGIVAYTGPLRGYGQVVIVRHDGTYYSVYAHLSGISVRKDARVTGGQKLGEVGYVESAACHGVHFQLYRKASPVDPQAHLARSG